MFRLRTQIGNQGFSELGLGTITLGPAGFPTLPDVNVSMYTGVCSK